MSHRFIRFSIPDYRSFDLNTKLEQYLRDCYESEPGLQFHKKQLDTEIIEEVNGFGKMVNINADNHMQAYSLMLVCDLDKNNIAPN